MSPEPSSSPAPAGGPDRAELERIIRAVIILYAAAAAWHLARALDPRIRAWQDSAVRETRRKLGGRESLPGLPHDRVRAIYDDTR